MDRERAESYDSTIHAFLEAHPEYREDVRWQPLPGEREAQATMRTKAMEAFIWWSYEKGLVGKPHKIPALLEWARAVERDSKSHHAGICNPETCILCRNGRRDA